MAAMRSSRFVLKVHVYSVYYFISCQCLLSLAPLKTQSRAELGEKRKMQVAKSLITLFTSIAAVSTDFSGVFPYCTKTRNVNTTCYFDARPTEKRNGWCSEVFSQQKSIFFFQNNLLKVDVKAKVSIPLFISFFVNK